MSLQICCFHRATAQFDGLIFFREHVTHQIWVIYLFMSMFIWKHFDKNSRKMAIKPGMRLEVDSYTKHTCTEFLPGVFLSKTLLNPPNSFEIFVRWKITRKDVFDEERFNKRQQRKEGKKPTTTIWFLKIAVILNHNYIYGY